MDLLLPLWGEKLIPTDAHTGSYRTHRARRANGEQSGKCWAEGEGAAELGTECAEGWEASLAGPPVHSFLFIHPSFIP